MVRSSLLFLSVCTASALLAQETVKSDDIAMMKVAPCDTSEAIVGTVKDRIAALESQMQEVFTGTELGDCGAKTASARPQIKSNRVFSKMDAFLWKAFVGGSDYASTNTDPGVSTVIGETKRADFNWRWGFRAEAGYRLPHDNWDALFNYTWFHDKSDRHVKSPSGGTIAPIIPPYLPYDPGASATLEGLLRFQNLDIELRRPYFLSRSFSVAPFFGLRNSWINQHYAVNYYSPSGEEEGADIFVTEVRSKQDFWGIGPVAGIGTEWHIFSEWWFFGQFAGALLASQYEITSRYVENNGTASLNKVRANTERMSPTVQGALGLGWHMNFNRDRNNVAVRLFYEAQYWWKQNLTLNFYDLNNSTVTRLGEDLGIHGFTLDLLFDF